MLAKVFAEIAARVRPGSGRGTAARAARQNPYLRPLRIESLEARRLLSAAPAATSVVAVPAYIPAAVAGPAGFSPAQIRAAYGFNATALNGAGTTIAIVNAYDDPNIAGDLRQFDAQFGLRTPALVKENQSGGTSGLPAANPIWAGEIALDVEWAHARHRLAAATILLVEANSAAASDLLAAVNTARHAPGVAVVSMSWGAAEFEGETGLDSLFTTPAGHAGVTFVAASGDSGAGVSYPAASPNVLSVGGTSLALYGGGYGSESAWSGSGGGVSRFEAQPAYQQGIVSQSYAGRATPDVALDADGNTGVAVYNSFSSVARLGRVWAARAAAALQVGGALVAGRSGPRANLGLKSLDGPSQTLPLLYAMLAGNFHDITTGGSTGSPELGTRPGYDLVTGRGTPQANLVIS